MSIQTKPQHKWTKRKLQALYGSRGTAMRALKATSARSWSGCTAESSRRPSSFTWSAGKRPKTVVHQQQSLGASLTHYSQSQKSERQQGAVPLTSLPCLVVGRRGILVGHLHPNFGKRATYVRPSSLPRAATQQTGTCSHNAGRTSWTRVLTANNARHSNGSAIAAIICKSSKRMQIRNDRASRAFCGEQLTV